MVNYWNRKYDMDQLEKTKNRITKLSTPGVNEPLPFQKRYSPKQDSPEESLTARESFVKSYSETPTAPKSWTQQKFAGKMNVGDFVSLAGGLSQAIAPDTAQGRVGGVLANYAGQEKARLKEERDYQRGEEDRSQSRELAGLNIDKARKSLSETEPPTEFGAYWKSETAKGTASSDIVKNFKGLGKTQTSRFKVVGNRLIDISGEEPKVVLPNLKTTDRKTLESMGLTKVGDSLVDISDPKNPKVVLPGGMKGAGTYKQRTLYKNGDELPIYSEKKYNEAIDNKWSPIKPGKTSTKKGGMSDVGKAAYENWETDFISEDGTRTTPNIRESLNQQKITTTQEKAYNDGWETVPKKDKNGNPIYLTPGGDVINYLGKKIGEVSLAEMAGIPSTLKKSR